jgi:hypothetical protein
VSTVEQLELLGAMQVIGLVETLRIRGRWTFALVSVWGLTDEQGLAGATFWDAPKALAGALPRLADTMRGVARDLDDAARVAGGPEWEAGSQQTVGGTVVDARARALFLRDGGGVLQAMAGVSDVELEGISRYPGGHVISAALKAACAAELDRRHRARDARGASEVTP